MTNNLKQKEIKVGFISLFAIILLIIGISVGNNISIGTNKHTLTFEFRNSSGIEPSAPVYINGVKRGKVISIIPVEKGVRIDAEIDRIDDLKSDVSARISMTEITGGKKIDIFPGIKSTKYDGKSVIIGQTSPDMGEMIAMLGEMGKEAQILIKRLDTLSYTAIKLTTNNEEKLSKAIDNTTQMIETLNSFVQNNVSNLQKAVNNLTQLTENLKSSYDKYEPRIDKLSTDIQTTINDTKQLLNKSENAIHNANELLTEFKKIAKDIQTDSSLVNKLIYDKNFANRVDSTLTNLLDLVNLIKQYGVNVNVRLGTRP